MKKSNIKNIIYLIIGLILNSLAFNLFFETNNLAAFGVSGLAIIIKKIFGINPALFVLIVNIFLIIISYIFLGKKLTNKSVIGSILHPLFLELLSFTPKVINISGVEPIFIAVIGGLLIGYGSGFIYKSGFTTGGSDIITFIINKYLKLPVNISILLSDGAVTLLGGIVFGPVKMFYSTVVLLMYSIFSNRILIGANNSKTFYIVTKKSRRIRKFITEELKLDVTIINGQGLFSFNPTRVLMTIVPNKYYFELKHQIKKIDAHAFISVADSYEVLNDYDYKKGNS